jgi:hypothetical protein
MIIQDNIQMNDVIRGWYFIKKDGKLIAKGHNTIVNDGRDFLAQTFLSSIGLIGTNDNDYANYKFYKIHPSQKIENSSDQTGFFDHVTTPTTTINNVNDFFIEDLEQYVLQNLTPDGKKYIDSVEFDSGSRKIQFKLIINGDDYVNNGGDGIYCLTEFSLTIAKYESDKWADGTNDTEKTETLFSRFLIDPIYITSGSKYELTYYIGF